MKRLKKWRLVSLVVIGLVMLGACGASKTSDTTTNTSSEKQEVVKVTDSNGKTLELASHPKKVVVFDMGALDTIREFGKSDVVVGAPLKTLPSYLSSYKNVESAGGIKEPDMEKINAMQPDLIIISGRQQDMQKELEKIAPTLYLAVDSKKAWESTMTNIETLGTVFAKEDVAKEKIDALNKQREALEKTAKESGKKGLMSLVNEGSLSVFGPESRFGIVYEGFGVLPADETIKPSPHGQEVSYEYVLEKNPDILFVVDRTKAIGGDASKNNVAENALVKETTAGKEGKVISLTPDVWYLAAGGIESTRIMMEDVETAYK
ncbi:siderophore ABC transporter substrate-binding protein [Vagococcus bubulae]|uniref:Iron ABC transporter substrate-binding protein n=1 Tax=Vagococcus bubulae TaxID=1977868 RepID=A0A429ZN32_9ENTE|nr:siderophore ABC transporter substrate-binding protein [Vagococcus bubulae]RST95059.1 iron ABC transporter substrate-binding protein [Vagococcus bubulae]